MDRTSLPTLSMHGIKIQNHHFIFNRKSFIIFLKLLIFILKDNIVITM
jgi:hypothetical protein